MRNLPSIDLALFWGIVGTIGTAHSLLLTGGTPWEATTWFYIVMWLSSMIILLFCRFSWGEQNQFDYDESLSQNKLLYLVGGFIAILFISSILVRTYTRSSIWVPIPNLSLTLGSISLSAVINDLFFTIALVSNSEETMVLSMSQVIRKKLAESTKYRSYVPALSIVIPRAGWATLHAYVSYTGALMPILVLSAFISGCIISYCAYNKRVRSFLVALLIHALFNMTVILASASGIL